MYYFRNLLNPYNYTLHESSKAGADIKCYLISSKQTLHHSTPMDLGIPVPKGMFRTPNPSPLQSPDASCEYLPVYDTPTVKPSCPMICIPVSICTFNYIPSYSFI